jgi:hypothetical protein
MKNNFLYSGHSSIFDKFENPRSFKKFRNSFLIEKRQILKNELRHCFKVTDLKHLCGNASMCALRLKLQQKRERELKEIKDTETGTKYWNIR